TLAVAESCTGGFIANTLTNIPGASAWFNGGVVAYANTAKSDILGVAPDLIIKHGAVSAPVAQAMANGVRQRFNTTFALATTGIAGPSGGTSSKPVGLVFIAIASSRETIAHKFFFTGTRAQIKRQTLHMSLELLLTRINKKPFSPFQKKTV
ncbi:MAG: CinA family protein, partial [Candidatus Omnitrophota bacterium]